MDSALTLREKGSGIGAPAVSLCLSWHGVCRVGWHQAAMEHRFLVAWGLVVLYFVCFLCGKESEVDGCFLKLCPTVWLLVLFHLALWREFGL